MATPAPAVTPDSPITLKVQYFNGTKKFKLALRELVASSLEDRLRQILCIPSELQCRFERYSDSAASYVTLDRGNPSVYKQLYRAAKAKQKLKLRVLAVSYPCPPSALRSTVEDEPEPSNVFAESTSASASTSNARASVVVSSSMSGTARGEENGRSQYPSIPGQWDDVDAHLQATLQNMARNHELLERNIARLGASVAEMGRRADTSSPPAVMAQGKEQDIVSASATSRCPASQTAPEGTSTATTATAEAAVLASATISPPVLPSGFSVCCNSCERNISNVHYHCSTCEEGDYDLCPSCVELGLSCYNDEHWLIKRYVKNGAIVSSKTERLPPKRTIPKEVAKTETQEQTQAQVQVQAPAQSQKQTQVMGLKDVASISDPTAVRRNFHSMAPAVTPAQTDLSARATVFDNLFASLDYQIRTCNNCIRDLPEREFLHCSVCFDFDLCKNCFAKNEHGHNPSHAFKPAIEGAVFGSSVTRRLPAGRGTHHNAVCDGCEKFISGVRHKCMNCPDWDYCSDCVLNADFIHPKHRFVPIYEPLGDATAFRTPHIGIFCDGPHCSSDYPRYIVGDRYKCAVCSNTDFCATCEASPANTHNKTHPLIKFKTPVRHVSVTTTGEHENGRRMAVMGDRLSHVPSEWYCNEARSCVKAETAKPVQLELNHVQTIVDVKPTEQPVIVSEPKREEVEETKPAVEAKAEAKKEVKVEIVQRPKPQVKVEDLIAVFQRDTVADGTVFPPNHVFEQTWILRNAGTVAWPAGCCVRFVGGDYMGHVDPNHPAGIQELVSASESTICYEPLAPGQEFPFTVLLRTPSRFGKAISYWRLTSKDGIKFGHRLWCEVDVQPKPSSEVKAKEEIKEELKEEIKEELKEETKDKVKEEIKEDVKKEAKEEVKEEVSEKVVSAPEELPERSQMIFPKLEKESPEASFHEPEMHKEAIGQSDDFDDDWAEDDSDEGFLTDEEYDILDASDEEFLDEKRDKAEKK